VCIAQKKRWNVKRQLEIQVEREGPVNVVTLAGAVDPSSVEDFKSRMNKVATEEPAVVLLDCSNLSYVNSQSLGLLFHYHRQCEQHKGKLALCCVWDKIQNILRLLGLDTVLAIYDSREEAMAGLLKEM
jgi:anti-sigma B factor antagonist